MSIRLQILGSGCARCRGLQENAEAAARSLGLDFETEKITDVNSMVAMGVMQTPALAVDGAVKMQGKVASVEEIAAWLPGGTEGAR